MIRFPVGIEIPGDDDRLPIDVLPDGPVGDTRRRFITQIVSESRHRGVVGNDLQGRGCLRCNSLMLSGDAKTRDGTWELAVRPSLCFEFGELGEPSIVATPVARNEPVIASVGYSLSADGGDLTLRVFTVTPGGEPVDSAFHWQAVVPCPVPPVVPLI